MIRRMYVGARTWNPFVGCEFDCIYCTPTFKAQAKRQRANCQHCYDYTPHFHSVRLDRIPNSEIVFVAAAGDISFCPRERTRDILEAIHRRNRRQTGLPNRPGWQTYYLQSKRPEYFAGLEPLLPRNVVLVTTLETNRNDGYEEISKAPPPSERYAQFAALEWPRKVVTIEPLLDFDPDDFASALRLLRPEYVWIGFNSRPRAVELPEPSERQVADLLRLLERAEIPVRRKDLRGLV
jgi:hypothetical protein